ncbi:unnamed protein product [Owenia fusiformis]|uniref:Macoilin n=1 Tax=Owenia fusiformis TaxID=6347 RepID=A0A8J1T9T4_OWEFU|nr:unnamed protein product [Owenia fusiformis]
MKRRNADCGKLRRPLKRSKITEGIYGSAFLYLKFLMVWALVLMADFILEFRFEYLWPFWLLMRSVYDSFKYQGLAFSVFFVCIAVTSDVICYLFVPVQWLFFAASTYVWVQYVWHTDRGICLPTVSLWLLFVYIEASVRLRDLRPTPLSFQLNLCRPFAAHCIGYPVVTLGFGFKSYISYKMRLRKQKDVQRDNDFYYMVLQQALPPELQQLNTEKQKAVTNTEEIALTPKDKEEEISSNGVQVASAPVKNSKSNSKADNTPSTTSPDKADKDIKHKHTNNIEDYEYIEKTLSRKQNNVNENDETLDQDSHQHNSNKAFKSSSAKTSKLNSSRESRKDKGKSNTAKESNTSSSTTTTNNLAASKDDNISKLESEIKRVKLDLQASRSIEQDLRSQINSLSLQDKAHKSELHQLRQDNESLQTKLHNLVTSRQHDKLTLADLNRKLTDERKAKATIEAQLAQERKAKKQEEAAAARAVAMAAAQRGECTMNCRLRRKELENDVNRMKLNTTSKDEHIHRLERDVQSLVQYKEAQNETDVLMSALSAMQDKNTHLENSLSAETRLKLDLFSALGEAKRQIEIQQDVIMTKELELADCKGKVAEVMALMPTGAYPSTCSNQMPLSYTAKFTTVNSNMNGIHESPMGQGSNLNPNATDYTPKSN